MKKMLFIAAFCCVAGMAKAQEFRELQDSHHNVIGYVGVNAQIFDKNKVFIGQFKGDPYQFTVLDRHRKTIGYIMKKGMEIQDATHKVLGYMKNDLTFENAAHVPVGYIKQDGTVEDAAHAVIGYELQTEPIWAGPYFFFYKMK